jgi:CBS domain-containing protein
MVPIGDYNTISEEATVYEAIQALRESFHRDGRAWYGHRSVVVLDGGGKPSGILTLRGILRAAGLRELDNDQDLKAESWGWYYIKKLREESHLRVRDIMRPLGLAAVRAGDDLTTVARALLKHSVNSLPVLKKGQVTGIVRAMDIFMAMDGYFS